MPEVLGAFEANKDLSTLLDEFSGILSFLEKNISNYLDVLLKFDISDEERYLLKSFKNKISSIDIQGARPIEIDNEFNIPYILYKASKVMDEMSPFVFESTPILSEIRKDISKIREISNNIIGLPVSKQTEIQTLIFSKDKFKTKSEAVMWAEEHNFSVHKVDETESSFRIRQKDPSMFKEGSFKTITLTDGVKAVIGVPKEEDKNLSKTENIDNIEEDKEINIEKELINLKIKVLYNTCEVEKRADGEQKRTALGVVLEPEVEDLQGDIYSEEEVEKAAWRWMINYQNTGIMHKEIDNEGIKVIESYIAPVDFEISGQKVRKGTWLLKTLYTKDHLWEKVKNGELKGFSIGGTAIREPEVVENG